MPQLIDSQCAGQFKDDFETAIKHFLEVAQNSAEHPDSAAQPNYFKYFDSQKLSIAAIQRDHELDLYMHYGATQFYKTITWRDTQEHWARIGEAVNKFVTLALI